MADGVLQDPADRFTYAALVSALLSSEQMTSHAWAKDLQARVSDHLKVEAGGKEALKQIMQMDPPCDPQPFAQDVLNRDLALPVIEDFVALCISDGTYDARERVVAERLVSILKHPFGLLDEVEDRLSQVLLEGQETEKQRAAREERSNASKFGRWMKMGAAGVTGAVLIGVTGGLAAPFVAAGLAGVIGTTGAAFLASTGGIAIITALFGVTGGGLGVYHMSNRVGEVEEFEFEALANENKNKLTVCIAVTGWLETDDSTFSEPWQLLPMFSSAEQWVLRWESAQLRSLSTAFGQLLANTVFTSAAQATLTRTVLAGLLSAAIWPLSLMSLGKLVDNPWANCSSRAADAGIMLAEALMQRPHGHRPVTLYGAGLGARVVYFCLEHLADHGGEGIVAAAYLIGAPVPASTAGFAKARSAVAGRFVNAYSKTDWLLRFVYRTFSASMSVAGLSAVEGVEGLENIEITGIVEKQSEYAEKMRTILLLMHGDDATREEIAVMVRAAAEAADEEVRAVTRGLEEDDDAAAAAAAMAAATGDDVAADPEVDDWQ